MWCRDEGCEDGWRHERVRGEESEKVGDSGSLYVPPKKTHRPSKNHYRVPKKTNNVSHQKQKKKKKTPTSNRNTSALTISVPVI
jgi:hypothetical protein